MMMELGVLVSGLRIYKSLADIPGFCNGKG